MLFAIATLDCLMPSKDLFDMWYQVLCRLSSTVRSESNAPSTTLSIAQLKAVLDGLQEMFTIGDGESTVRSSFFGNPPSSSQRMAPTGSTLPGPAEPPATANLPTQEQPTVTDATDVDDEIDPQQMWTHKQIINYTMERLAQGECKKI